jgi:hypothetical protein
MDSLSTVMGAAERVRAYPAAPTPALGHRPSSGRRAWPSSSGLRPPAAGTTDAVVIALFERLRRQETCTSDKSSKPASASVVSSDRSVARADPAMIRSWWPRGRRVPEYRPDLPIAEIVLSSTGHLQHAAGGAADRGGGWRCGARTSCPCAAPEARVKRKRPVTGGPSCPAECLLGRSGQGFDDHDRTGPIRHVRASKASVGHKIISGDARGWLLQRLH